MLSLPKTLKIIASYLVWVAKFLTEVGHIFCLDDMHQCLMAAKEVLDPIVSHYILSVELGTCAILSFEIKTCFPHTMDHKQFDEFSGLIFSKLRFA